MVPCWNYIVVLVALLGSELFAAEGVPLVGHTAGVTTIEFSSDGSHLLSGSQDGSIRLWDLERKQTEVTILLDGEVEFVRFLGPDHAVAVVKEEKAVKQTIRGSARVPERKASSVHVCDLKAGNVACSTDQLGSRGLGEVMGCAGSRDGSVLAVRLVPDDTESGVEVAILRAMDLSVVTRRFMPHIQKQWTFYKAGIPPLEAFVADKPILASVESVPRGDEIHFLNGVEGAVIRRIACPGRIEWLVLSPNGEAVAALFRQGTGRKSSGAAGVWRVNDGSALAQCQLGPGGMSSIGFLGDSRVGLTMVGLPSLKGRETSIWFSGARVLDVTTNRVSPMAGYQAPTVRNQFMELGHTAAFGPTGRWIAVGHPRRDLMYVFDVGNPERPLALPYSYWQYLYCSHLAFSPHDRYLVSACVPSPANADWNDRYLTVWDLGTSPSSSTSSPQP